MGSALTLIVCVGIELIVGHLAGVGKLVWKNDMCLVSEKETQILRKFFCFFLFFNYNELCFIISLKKTGGIIKPQSVVPCLLFSNCT